MKLSGKIRIVLLLVAAVVLAVAPIHGIGYWYYRLLRIVVSGISVLVVVADRRKGLNYSNIVCGFCAILFNPFFPLYLGREVWLVFDLVFACWFSFLAMKSGARE